MQSKLFIAGVTAVFAVLSTLVGTEYKKWSERAVLKGETVQVVRGAPKTTVVNIAADPDLQCLGSGALGWYVRYKPEVAAALLAPAKFAPDNGQPNPGGAAAAAPVGVPASLLFFTLDDLPELVLYTELPDGLPLLDPRLIELKAAIPKAKARIKALREEMTTKQGHFALDVLVTNTGGKNLSVVKARLIHTDTAGKERTTNLVLPDSGKPIQLAPDLSQPIRLMTHPFDSNGEAGDLREINTLFGTGQCHVVLTDSRGVDWALTKTDFKLP
ncbi:MAG: hypothetical protein J0I06_06355 [Planctomycetes bacterium]|nr:hypothetical protein [Planctomycetota bacterium]